MLKAIKNINLRELFYNRKFTITLSVILAVIIWFVVIINRNPTRDRTFTDVTASISLENTYVSEMGLGIASDISKTKFTVTVSGPNYVVSSLKPEDFSLTASVSDANINESGRRTLKVMGVRNGAKTDYEFVSITPSTIDVTFDYFDTKTYTVIPKLDGVIAADNLIAENPVISQNPQIEINGPRNVMNKIDSVVAYYTVDRTLSKTENFDADLILYDAAGKIIYRYHTAPDGSMVIYDSSEKIVTNNYITLSGIDRITVTQPISKMVSLKVKPEFKNLPAGINASDVSYSLNIGSVAVIGTPDIVSNMSQLTLMPIDFNSVSGSKSSVTFNVLPNLPDGVRVFDNIDTFEVKIDTSGYSEKVFTVSTIKAVGQQNGLSVTTSGKITNVKICGPRKVISALKASDLYAEVDLTGKTAGQYSVPPTIKSSKYNNIWVYGSAGEVTVTLK